jgi:inorganic pyrophosphatase
MDISKITAGKNPPSEVFAVVEIPMNSFIKYELDKDSSAVFVDRFLTMAYPCNYGFIPDTLGGDGDPLDILVHSNHQIAPGAVISVRPIGVLITEDENGSDEKIFAVPAGKIDPFFNNISTYTDLPQIFLDKVSHFFEHYKDLEKGKWVKVLGWKGVEEAHEIIKKSIVKS